MDELHDARGNSANEGCGHACGCGRSTRDVSGTDRRTFLAQGAAALAMMALAACGMSTDTGPSSLSATTINLSSSPALADIGGVAVMQISGTPVAIVRESSSSFSAFSLICPHAGNIVQTNGSQGFYCPGHGARFSLTGQWIGGQPTSSLRSYPVQYDAAAGTLVIGG